MTLPKPVTDFRAANDERCVLAKLIYSMTDRQRAEFRRSWPPGIRDEDVAASIACARRIANP